MPDEINVPNKIDRIDEFKPIPRKSRNLGQARVEMDRIDNLGTAMEDVTGLLNDMIDTVNQIIDIAQVLVTKKAKQATAKKTPAPTNQGNQTTGE